MTTPDSVQDRINEYWSVRAPGYDDYQQRPERRDLDLAAWSRIWSDALPPAPADVLDVGTGSGYVALLLATLGHRVTGIDLAGGMLARAREHAAALPAGVTPPGFEAGDAVAPAYAPESFDAVTGRYVAWTLRQTGDALAAWWKLLRPGGVLALVDSTWFPDGIDDRPTGDTGIADHYDAEVRAALPLHDADSIGATAPAVAEAGFSNVIVTPLEQILELDREHGAAPGHEVQVQYLITAHR